MHIVLLIVWAALLSIVIDKINRLVPILPESVNKIPGIRFVVVGAVLIVSIFLLRAGAKAFGTKFPIKIE